jgi:hypothetical protein
MTSTPSQVAADIAALGLSAPKAAHKITQHYTAMLQREVVSNASGRPGPNAPTGDYRRSIGRRTSSTPAGSEGQVGTNKPQGRRLEHGFSGADSLGRVYDQPPYPHFGPALDKVAPQFQAAIFRLHGVISARRGPR